MKDYIIPEGCSLNIDWEAFRREAAMMAMLGILAGRKTHQGIQETAEYAVSYADELIKQLKKETDTDKTPNLIGYESTRQDIC